MSKFDFISKAEAASLMGKMESTLDSWRSRKIGPGYFKINGTVKYSKKAILDYVGKCFVEHDNRK